MHRWTGKLPTTEWGMSERKNDNHCNNSMLKSPVNDEGLLLNQVPLSDDDGSCFCYDACLGMNYSPGTYKSMTFKKSINNSLRSVVAKLFTYPLRHTMSYPVSPHGQRITVKAEFTYHHLWKCVHFPSPLELN